MKAKMPRREEPDPKDTDSVRSYLEQGGDPNAGAGGYANLLDATYSNANIEAFRLVLSWGGDPNAVTSAHGTLLHMIGRYFQLDWAIAILKFGSNVDLEVRDRWGNTPLMKAVANANGRPELVKLLLDHGADPDAENEDGFTPRKVAGIRNEGGDISYLFSSQ